MAAAAPAAAAGVHTGQCLIGGAWVVGAGPVTRRIPNPADVRETVADVREASMEQVDAAIEAAHKAWSLWRSTPAPERAHVMFRFRELLEANAAELAALIVRENGKLLSEARGDVRRGIDVVEVACGAPALMTGRTLPDVSHNVDVYDILEPLGVVAGVPPMNFPAMIPLWMMPMAVVTGNCFVLKPTEKAPLTGTRIAELLQQAGVPAGVISVVQGGREVSERLIGHPLVKAVSFVGSSPVAASVYKLGGAAGKRVQALGGAKNHLIVMPDADLARTMPALLGSCFGCTGQRCLAGSVLVPVGDAARQEAVVEAFVKGAAALRIGDGMDAASQMGPLISMESRDRVAGWVATGVSEGAVLRLDGRGVACEARPHGCFMGATVLDHCDPATMSVAREEVFGPLACVVRAADLDAAITLANASRFGNSASIFTADGAAVRTFRSRIQAGMLGINLGVPAPFAAFSFAGWKASIFGAAGAHGLDSIAFYTHKKVVSERWFGAEAPKDGWV